MGKVKLWVDGTQIEAEEGQSVLNAALAADIYIPHICSHPDLEAQGGCKLCVVDIEGQDGPVCSCMTYVKEGMKVRTKGETLDAIRRTSMQVMMASHPQCTGCRSFGNCEFQALQQYLSSVNHPGMREFHKETVNLNTNNPLIDRDMVRCIQCGRCVRVCADVRGVNVLRYNRVDETGETYVGTLNDFSLPEADCRFCGACVEVCPTGALQDREGIFRTDVPREQALIPCTLECPAHINVPNYLRMIAAGEYDKAVGVIREKVPFPHALGYVCTHYCEKGCKRKGLNEAISIRDLKRFAVEHDTKESWKEKAYHLPATGKKVAIIGGGPSGLSCAYYLALRGHGVTVYEEREQLGGMLRYGIPSYRFPREKLDAEIESILSLGIEVHTGVTVGRDIWLEKLEQEYDCIYIAIGAHQDKKTGIPGENSKNVISAVEMLRALGDNEMPDFTGKQVVVIGGGNVAMDVTRSSIRLGADKVTCVYRRRQADMTALPDEITGALAEGAELMTLAAPVRIEADEDGRTSNPKVWAGGDIVTGAATVILAMGAGKKAAASMKKALLGE